MVSRQIRGSHEPDVPQWDAVAGAGFVVAFPAPAPEPLLLDFLVRAAEVDPTLESLIGAIPLGADGVEGFALVHWSRSAEVVTTVIRGDTVVDLASPGGRRRLEARGIRPWHLAEFRDVDALRIGTAAMRLDAMDVPGAGGAIRVRASEIEWRATWDGADGPQAAEPPAEPPGEPAAEPAAEPVRADSAPRSAVAPFAFRVAGGTPRLARVPVLIGRRPRPPRITGEPVELVAIDGADAVSGTHLELRREGSRIVATDLRSTNGTLVRTADGDRRLLAGESVVVQPGAILELGGATIVEILPTQQDQIHPDRQASE